MSGSPSSPRFRIRLDDGSEMPIDSVEGLARRVARGDLLPDTPLYDASTGEWRDAGEASVVRFILEELVRDGEELPPGWSPFVEEASDPPSSSPPSDSAAIEDPLDIGVFLEDIPPIPPPLPPEGSQDRLDPEGTGSEVGRPARPDPWGPEFRRRKRSDEWLTPTSDGGLFTAGPETTEDAEKDAHEGDAREASPGTGSVQPDRDVDAPEREVRKTPPPKTRPTSPLTGARWRWVAGVVAVVVVVGSFLLGDDGEEGLAGEDGSQAGALALDAEPLVPPSGLEEPARRAAERVSDRFRSAVDSLRSARGLAETPPGTWLSGYYLANAFEFPEVREYWARYGALVEELRLRDREFFTDVLRAGLGPDVVEVEQRDRLESYLRARYATTLAARRNRYSQRALVSASALELHDFLVERSEDLEFTPAVGSSVPRDPVLEVDTQDPEVQSELEAHLDELFRALDRSRGGGAPSLSGLRTDLYSGFGEF